MNSPAPVERKKTTAWEMYRSIVGIGAFCAVLLVGVFKATEARIADNKARFLAAAVTEVLPASRTTVEVTKDADGRLVAAAEPASLPVFLGYGEDGELVGAAITARAMGYADYVTVLFSYSFEKRAIIGSKVLESKETPGLGDKVEIEPHFLANFEALDARLNADGTALANAIVHGCQQNRELTVRISVGCDQERGMIIVVKDPGSGFDPAELPNPIVGENLYSEGGRGIFLINRLMDEVRFRDKGTEIWMRKS